MDALRPGHAHRSSSDRLLNNYLDSQKHLSTSLLTLLSHSHSSSSSLLAYVTSSPGVNHPVRRSVRHAGFEGPLSASLAGGGDHHENGGNIETQGWSAYVSSLDAFRKDLKQIHLLEEELSRVKRDREILVTRLIKTTKSRPKKSDLSAIAANYQVGSSRASVSSMTSNGSSASKMSKREGKLADAQAELLGCEEHLRSLEVRIEQERNQVMNRGLEDRFRAMEAVGRMWVSQSQRGMQDLEKAGDLPADAYELDSNHSLAPSQSASQIAYEDSPSRSGWRGGHRLVGPGSIAGSIAEENEESSDDGNQRNLTVHENRPGSRASAMKSNGPSAPTKSFPSGVPSVNSRARPLSSTALAQNNQQSGGNDSDSDVPNNRAGGRRAASDVGGMGYHPPTGRQPLRRTFSAEGRNQNGRAGSDRSSIRSGRSGGGKKKKGFFASISRMFKGSKRQDRSGSPPYGSGSKSWHTRTDSNIKRSSMFGSTRGRGGDDSSSDDDNGNFVSVSNNRQSGTWSVDQVGRAPSRASVKRSSSGPVASGLIPQKPTRANMKRESSQSTITGRDTPRSGAATPTLASQKAKSGGFPAASGFSSGTIPRSNTARSTISVASARSNNTVKSNGTATANKTRPNGSIARSATEPKNIMSLVDNKSGPTMPEVPKAPKSQVNPQMSLPTAPGSSLVAPQKVGNLSMTGKQTVSPTQTAGGGIARSQSMKSTKSTATVPKKATKEAESAADKPTTPLPPSRLAPAPLKSALRPKSPGPPSAPAKPVEQPKNMFSISAPGPVNLPEQTPEPFKIPAAKNKPERPISAKRNSFQSNASVADGNSVYESAMEDGGNGGGDESSGSESDTEDYKVVDNERVKRLGINVGPPEIQRVPSEQRQAHQDEHEAGADSDTSVDTATHKRQSGPPPTLAPVITTGARTAPSESGSTVARRKSVRMAVPDSPGPDSEFQTDRAPSPVADAPREQSQWKSRIGDMREDTSDESDHDPEYLAARKGLSRNSGQFEQGADGKRKKTGTSRSGSVKSKSSVRGK